MGSGARLRSANQAFGRSQTNAFLLTAEPPPQPSFDCWALDVGTISIIFSDSWDLPECSQGQISFAAHHHDANCILTSAILNCDQTGYLVRGRTSGVETYMGVLEKGSGNCDLACIVEVSPGVYNEGGRGFWIGGATSQWILGCGQYNPALLGYTNNERIDLLVTNCWRNSILSVEAEPGISVFPRLTLAQPHQLEISMWVQITNSTLYDGVWEVFDVPSANVLTLYNTVRDFAGDDTGVLNPKYDYKP